MSEPTKTRRHFLDITAKKLASAGLLATLGLAASKKGRVVLNEAAEITGLVEEAEAACSYLGQENRWSDSCNPHVSCWYKLNCDGAIVWRRQYCGYCVGHP